MSRAQIKRTVDDIILRMKVIVIGAGLLGLTTAYCLRRHGLDVVVIERQPGPGMETSFANGGMLHASQASPWNEPGILWRALRMLGREDSALLIRPRALPRMLAWCVAFVRNSQPSRYLQNVEKNARLADYSLSMLGEHYAPLALEYDRAGMGTLKIYRTPADLESAKEVAELCNKWDVRYSILRVDEVIAVEPALDPIRAEISGGIHFPDDVSGDAHKFCRELQRQCSEDGVDFRFDTAVSRLVVRNARFDHVAEDGGTLHADACVLAAGSYSTALAAQAGVRLPVQPVKGYSITLPFDDWAERPRTPVIDEHYHAAVCPLGGRLRVAGTAEFAGFDDRLTARRIDNLYHLMERLYPASTPLINRERSAHWTGLRPMSPDGVGIMGTTPIRGLYLNTGHGHLGWTMAPGAGKLVADCVASHLPDLNLADYALSRF